MNQKYRQFTIYVIITLLMTHYCISNNTTVVEGASFTVTTYNLTPLITMHLKPLKSIYSSTLLMYSFQELSVYLTTSSISSLYSSLHNISNWNNVLFTSRHLFDSCSYLLKLELLHRLGSDIKKWMSL